MPDENVETTEAPAEEPEAPAETSETSGEETPSTDTSVEAADKKESAGETLDLTESQYELIRDLLDPKTQRAAVERLAREQNLISDGDYRPKATRVDQERPPEKAKPSLIEEIKELMGDEFENVPKSTWRAVERLFDAKMEPIREQFQEIEANRVNAESKAATAALYGKYKDAERYARDMVGLMENYVPAKGQTQGEFLEDMYFLAKSRRTVPNKDAGKFIARVRSNSKEEKIATGGSVDDRNIAAGSSRKISLDEAARLAMAGKKITR